MQVERQFQIFAYFLQMHIAQTDFRTDACTLVNFISKYLFRMFQNRKYKSFGVYGFRFVLLRMTIDFAPNLKLCCFCVF